MKESIRLLSVTVNRSFPILDRMYPLGLFAKSFYICLVFQSIFFLILKLITLKQAFLLVMIVLFPTWWRHSCSWSLATSCDSHRPWLVYYWIFLWWFVCDVLVSNKIICSENTRIQPDFKVKETTPCDILDTLEQDFKEVEEKKGLSQEDKRFLEITSHRHQTDEGRFKIPLHFKEDIPT